MSPRIMDAIKKVRKINNIVIFHSDGDGIMSAAVVGKHLWTVNSDEDVWFEMYNHGKPTHRIEQICDIFPEATIWVVDLRLPDPIMDKYAERIVWIDHHKDIIETDKEWKSRLKENHSKISVEFDEHVLLSTETGVDPNKLQIAACELCYLTLFPNESAPAALRYAGRYDVWDFNEETDFNILDFSIVLYDYVGKFKDSNGSQECIKDLIQLVFFHDTRLTMLMANAAKEREAKDIVQAKEAKIAITYHTILDKYKVAIANRGSVGSTYFSRVIHDDRADIFIPYDYRVKNGSWTISFYKNKHSKAKFSALEVMKQCVKCTTTCISNGGHKDACGMCITDINEFLNLLK